MSQISLYSVDLAELTEIIESWRTPRADARRLARAVWRQVHTNPVTDFSSLAEIPSQLQQRLDTTFTLSLPVTLARSTSTEGETRKDLLDLADGAQIETVLLRYRDRYTVCVSTQVGCACNCSFCATGQMGFVRQLSSEEIVAQVLHFQRRLVPQGKAVSNAVFMGMGEPLLNLDQTTAAVERLTDPRGLSLAPGRITVSTVGIPAGIVQLAGIHRRWPVKLAISLHAATDAVRSTLMPINRTYPLAHLHEAARIYTEQTRRHVLLEWVMISGINDTPEQALALVDWLDDLPAHINLIQLNATSIFDGEASSEEAIETFSAILDQHGIPHTMRQRRGTTIDAGCGQLYTRHQQTLDVT